VLLLRALLRFAVFATEVFPGHAMRYSGLELSTVRMKEHYA
jgi:hypothetical protein